MFLQHNVTHCNTLQQTAVHCNTPQHTATHRDTPQHTATRCNTLVRAATRCNTLVRKNLYASKSVQIVVEKSIYSFYGVRHSTAYIFRVNIDGKKLMGQFWVSRPLPPSTIIAFLAGRGSISSSYGE